MKFLAGFLLFALATLACMAAAQKPVLTVASKTFPESYILAEIAAEAIEEAGEVSVVRKFGLGATGIVYQALVSGAVDLYPEYSGTISEAFLKDASIKDLAEIRKRIRPLGLEVTAPLGFNNTYALGVSKTFAANGIRTLSELARQPNARLGLSHELMSRADGYAGLAKLYGFHFSNLRTLQHALAYQAIALGEIDVTDVYSTDADIQRLGLVVLSDDLGYFPTYQGVFLARTEWTVKYPRTWQALRRLELSLSQEKMIELNSLVETQKRSFSEAAQYFLHGATAAAPGQAPLLKDLAQRTREHLELVLLSLLASILIGLPMGVAAYYQRSLRRTILTMSGLIQTIPSLALLAFLIPVFGIGKAPALVALVLYGLLPVVVNTFTGLEMIEPGILESAQGLGLSRGRILWEVLLPIASPNILIGIRTSAVIGIGTATLAALVGAGGYGAPIMTGLALNDVPTILQGAIPAATLALLVQIGFDWAAKKVIPRGLQK